MKEHLTTALDGVDTIAIARERVIAVMERVKRAGDHQKLGFISGIISSDGDEYIARNVHLLAIRTYRLREQYHFPIFSATDVFSPELFERLAEMRLDRLEREQHFIDFWRAILTCGHVTHVFMTHRWEESVGARDEYDTATRLGLQITHIEPESPSRLEEMLASLADATHLLRTS